MAFDPSVNLALAMTAGPGQYALLLGSGISRSAGIPTGWEVTLDLISKAALATDGKPTADPEAWWKERRTATPEYSKLLEELAPLPSERAQLLRGYFEPTVEEREAGIKLPSPAHRAIGNLVAKGIVRVIVTTNFDRLLEQAIQDAGIAPIVISTADQAVGASPLVHNACTVVKVNGDYLDTRIKNSESELSSYDPNMDALLDRILDEYGLVVCGWSGEWDIALRAAVLRAKGRRYTTYWAGRGTPRSAAANLIAHRQAVCVPIANADEFFGDLTDRIAALQESGDDPESIAVALAQLKRYLARQEDRIRYADLMRRTVEDLVRTTDDDRFPLASSTLTEDDCVKRLKQYTVLSSRAIHLVATATYWGSANHREEVLTAIRRLTEAPHGQAGRSVLVEMVRYPALLTMYAAGVAMVSRHDFAALNSLFSAEVRAHNGRQPLTDALYPYSAVEVNLAQHLRGGGKNFHTPLSDELYEVLREAFRDLIPSDTEYSDTFDRFEYLLSLTQADRRITASRSVRASGGCFQWRRSSDSGEWLPTVVATEIARDGADWPPLKGGMFGGSGERLAAAKAEIDAWSRKVAW